MSFGGGGFFGSGASQSEADSQVSETGQQTQGSSAAFALTGNRLDDGNTITINSTDHGSIANAFLFADSANDLTFQQLQNSLEFTAGAVQEVLGKNEITNTNALAFSEGVIGAALDGVIQSNNEAFEFSAGAVIESNSIVSRGFDALGVASNDALNFAAQGFQAAQAFTERAFDASLASNANAVDVIQQVSKSETSQLSSKLIFPLMALIGVMALRASK